MDQQTEALLCPKKPAWLVSDDESSPRTPLRCGSYRCGICGADKVRERVRLMAWAFSQVDWIRHWTLTLVPPEWQRARMQIRDLLRRLRKRYSMEAAWAIERNPKETGYHAHMMTWGVYVPHAEMMTLWGGRICYVTPIQISETNYVAKCMEVAGYTTKNGDRFEHLRLNGGRAVHMSRGFLHGWTSRQVLKTMGSGGTWRVVKASKEEIDASKDEWLNVDRASMLNVLRSAA